MVSAERTVREQSVAGAPRALPSAPPVPPHFLGSHRLRSLLSGSPPPALSVPGRKTLIQYVLDTHKLSNGAKAENVNVGLAKTK